jgi:hypothetical protein
MANLDFKSDLKLGNDGEMFVVSFLETKGLRYLSSNDDNKYDIVMCDKDGIELTYEIKTDVKCAPLFDTGNIFIEFESRGKDSGIVVTQADWFVTYFKYLNEAWFIKSDKLKELIQENDFPIFKDAGDVGSATHGYLIKRKDFKKYFYVCKI